MQMIVDKAGMVVNLNDLPDSVGFEFASSLFRMTMTENVKFCIEPEDVRIRFPT